MVALGLQSLVIWTYGLAALAGSIIGAHIGTNFAIKKGANFIKVMLAIVMLVSGVALLI